MTLTAWLRAPREGTRFRGLLVMTFVVVLTMPFGAKSVLGTRLVVVLFHAMLLSALYAVATTRRRALVGAALVVLSVVLGLAGRRIAADALAILFVVFCCQQVLVFVLAKGRVTTDKLLASLCVYMLLGLVWAEVYTTLEQQAPGSFANLSPEESRAPSMPIMLELGYFSFVTQTTLGYGDIVPTSHVARMLSILQAITSQLYLTVLVARLVALHITTRDDLVSDEGPGPADG